mgnify:CR=1 FL=1
MDGDQLNNGASQMKRFVSGLAVVVSLGSVGAFADTQQSSSAEIKHDRNEIWVSHDFESRALCEVYIDGELVGRQQRVPSWVPFIYKHDSSLRDVSSWEGHCEVVPHGRGGKAVDYSREAVNANFDREREKYLIRQGSTLSEKFEVHESAKTLGSGMSQSDRDQAISNAKARYEEGKRSGRIPPQGKSLAGDNHKTELQELLDSIGK